MASGLINIRTDRFSKEEIFVIEKCLKEWNWSELVSIAYVGNNEEGNLDVCFTLDKDDLGEFIWLIFGCGYEFVYNH